MTVEITTNFTMSHTFDQEILSELEATFDGFRSRIATMSVEVFDTLTDIFSPLGPDVAVIDIDAIEWEQLELQIVAGERSSVLELAAAR